MKLLSIHLLLPACFLLGSCVSQRVFEVQETYPASVVITPYYRHLSISENKNIQGVTIKQPRSLREYTAAERIFLQETYLNAFTESMTNTGFFYKATRNDSVAPGQLMLDSLVITSRYLQSSMLDFVQLQLDLIYDSYFTLHRSGRESESYQFADTLYWESYGETPTMAMEGLPSTREIITEATTRIGADAARYFAPYQLSAERRYYTYPGLELREANSYWNEGMYTEASYLWEDISSRHPKGKIRGVTEANLALYHELTGDIDKAITHCINAITMLPDDEYLAGYLIVLHTLKDRKKLLDKQIY